MYDEDYRWRDKRGRQITFEIGEDITAFVGGRQVGAIEFGDMDGSPYLRHMDVDEAYRRAGIATEMMRLGNGNDAAGGGSARAELRAPQFFGDRRLGKG
ncbi:TPA: GNAT family N-acetyltransferase [Stenotrophomonas maltophilia]